jgi:hypothetical protein
MDLLSLVGRVFHEKILTDLIGVSGQASKLLHRRELSGCQKMVSTPSSSACAGFRIWSYIWTLRISTTSLVWEPRASASC